MNILALDTAGSSVCLVLKTNAKTYCWQRPSSFAHDEILIPAVERLLARAKISLKDLNAIVVASGPGRFTGIRIGMAYAAVAADQLKISALSVSRLLAIAFATPEAKICAVISGPREEKFYQLFTRKNNLPKPLENPSWTSAEDWPKFEESLKARGFFMAKPAACAAFLIAPAEHFLKRKKLPPFEPLYLKTAGYEKKPNPQGQRR